MLGLGRTSWLTTISKSPNAHHHVLPTGRRGITMARGRTTKKGSTGRDSGGFIALPWSVMDTPSYKALSHPARSLLLEIARQFVIDNNGRLLCSRRYLLSRGWNSNDTINRAKTELIEKGFIFETVKGRRPKRASWYAVTWYTLDKIPGYDAGAEKGFERSAYAKNSTQKNASAIPLGGVKPAMIAPPDGTATTCAAPPHGTVKLRLLQSSAPPDGHHLDMPSMVQQNRPRRTDDDAWAINGAAQ